MKAKLKGAEIGHNLLKRKSEALTKFVTRLPYYVSGALRLTRISPLLGAFEVHTDTQTLLRNPVRIVSDIRRNRNHQAHR